jgi:hypothetical protein
VAPPPHAAPQTPHGPTAHPKVSHGHGAHASAAAGRGRAAVAAAAESARQAASGSGPPVAFTHATARDRFPPPHAALQGVQGPTAQRAAALHVVLQGSAAGGRAAASHSPGPTTAPEPAPALTQTTGRNR